jgi:hypothetical protein
MKQHYPAALQSHTMKNIRVLVGGMMMLMSFGLFSCQKAALEQPVKEDSDETAVTAERRGHHDPFALHWYKNLSFRTRWELQQARSATAKYQDINNAIADGYQDIAVDVENMGHHFMKLSLVNGTFDIRHPQILVYNKDRKGRQQLVAVEYAVPLSDPQPEGFYGDSDVWDGNTGFGLWLLHAWVWYFNPDGVFAPFNPRVDLH